MFRNLVSLDNSAITVSGNSGPFESALLTEFAVDINLSAITGGGTATFAIQRLSQDGNWYNAWESSALSTAESVSVSIGRGLSTAESLGSNARLTWTLTGGTSPSISFTASVIGK